MKDSEEALSPGEVDARREAGLKKLLATPPKPHKPKSEKGDATKPERKSR